MSDTPHEPQPAGGTVPARNKGQRLVHAYRLARIAARPVLRTELRECRTELQQQRLGRQGHGGAPAAPPPQAPAPPMGATLDPVADMVPGGEAVASIFATYCVAMDAPPDAQPAPPATAADEATSHSEAAPEAPAMPEPTPAAPIPPHVVPLSAIGFGPGMTIRMRQLGIETAGDLAAADATWLQTALGDLSDLVHAESWIASARHACSQAA